MTMTSSIPMDADEPPPLTTARATNPLPAPVATYNYTRGVAEPLANWRAPTTTAAPDKHWSTPVASPEVPELIPANLEGWGEHMDGDWSNAGMLWPDPEQDLGTVGAAWWDPVKRERDPRPGHGVLPRLMCGRLTDLNLRTVAITPPTLADMRVDPPPGAAPPPAPPPDWRVPSAQEVQAARPHMHALYAPDEHAWRIVAFTRGNPPLGDGHALPTGRTADSCEQSYTATHHMHLFQAAAAASECFPGYEPRVRDEPAVRADVWACCACLFWGAVSEPIAGVVPLDVIRAFTEEKNEHPTPGRTPGESVVNAFDVALKMIENLLWRGNTSSVRTITLAVRLLIIRSADFFSALHFSLEKVAASAAIPQPGPAPTSPLPAPPPAPPKQETFPPAHWGVQPEPRPISPTVASAPPEREPFPPPHWGSGALNTSPPTSPLPHALLASASAAASTSSLSAAIPAHVLLRPPAVAEHDGVERARLLRAWLELRLWVDEYRRNCGVAALGSRQYVKTERADEWLARITTLDAERMEHGFPAWGPWDHAAFDELGMTADSFSAAALVFAYTAQVRCDPARTAQAFTRLCALHARSPALPAVDELVATERSRGRWVIADLAEAARTLGFGADNTLGIELDSIGRFWDAPQPPPGGWPEDDRWIADAFRDAVRRQPARRRALKEALNIIAEFRGSALLKAVHDEKERMGLEAACAALEVPHDIDEEMLLSVYGFRVDENPAQIEKMREALDVIAESRDSARLRAFLATGNDPGAPHAPARQDWPRGLNQLGNTCYLNSLLQYFYTIKDLRAAICPDPGPDVADPPVPAATMEKDDKGVTEEELKRLRVGGRLVTRAEVARSREFVAQLASLFADLRADSAPAVTPSLALAKLALVTSKDEEEDAARAADARRPGTDSSVSTDATLVEDGPAPVPAPDPAPTSARVSEEGPASGGMSPVEVGSVLGKRVRRSWPTSAAERPLDDEHEDAPPPLPPRKKASASAETGMMFGKQHDVAECMDNCMFQIETALLRFDGEAAAETMSVVKRLFYGKLRQRIAAPGKVLEQEGVFSSLPVNVVDSEAPAVEGGTYDLYDGLSAYFDDDVEHEGGTARMEVALVELPPIIQIQLQRVQFNRETMQPYKSHAYVKFGEELFMDRFLAGGDAGTRERAKGVLEEIKGVRARIKALTQDKYAPYGEALAAAAAFLGQDGTLQKPPGLSALLADEAKHIADELAALRAHAAALKARGEALWAEARSAAYELTSVFVHRGAGPGYGHYFFYARNLPDRPDEWFKYNDAEVSVVGRDEVLRDTTGDTANAYLLVYARKGLDVMHTVNRAPAPESAPPEGIVAEAQGAGA